MSKETVFCCDACFGGILFADIAIRSTFGKKCTYCKGHSRSYYKPNDLRPYFADLINVFQLDESSGKTIVDYYSHWNIFGENIDENAKTNLIQDIYMDDYNYSLTDKKVSIKPIDQDLLISPFSLEEDVLATLQSKGCAIQDMFNEDIFLIFVRKSLDKIEKITPMFRCRVADKTKSFFNTSELGAPPPENAKAGRCNEDGESVLYLSKSPNSALFETLSDYPGNYYRGEFSLSDTKTVVSLEKMCKLNPFDFYITDDTEQDGKLSKLDCYMLFCNNFDVVYDIGRLFAETKSSDFDYLCTQYFTKVIKNSSIEYEGIEYISTKDPISYVPLNTVLFDISGAGCISFDRVPDDDVKKARDLQTQFSCNSNRKSKYPQILKLYQKHKITVVSNNIFMNQMDLTPNSATILLPKRVSND